MERNGLMKFVYEDNKITKVLKGYLLEEREFEYKIEAVGTGDVITIGKRAIVKVIEVRG